MGEPFVCVVNLGCRVNRAESDRIVSEFARAGAAVVDADDADLIVINTCAVTGEAEAKTRKAVRHALARRRAPLVVATGCAASLHPASLTEISERVTVVPSKADVVERSMELVGALGAKVAAASGAIDPALLGRSRLGVKVQDGCDNRCTYCIVWKARGPERSVPVDAVIDRVRQIERAGIPEVVLTGVNLGAYDGRSAGDEHVEIDELLRAILERTSIPHVRLSSIEPQDVDGRLVEVMARHADRVAPFLHLPLQSGSSATLERMGRPYTAEDFLATVSEVRRDLPGASISCDVIVGFPGEDEREFQESMATCREAGFSRMHVFRFSPRPGTVAAEAPDQVPPTVSAERSARMRSLAAELSAADARSRIGTTERAVIEHGDHATLGSFHRARVVDAPPFDAPCLVDVGIMGVEASGELVARMDAAR